MTIVKVLARRTTRKRDNPHKNDNPVTALRIFRKGQMTEGYYIRDRIVSRKYNRIESPATRAKHETGRTDHILPMNGDRDHSLSCCGCHARYYYTCTFTYTQWRDNTHMSGSSGLRYNRDKHSDTVCYLVN